MKGRINAFSLLTVILYLFISPVWAEESPDLSLRQAADNIKFENALQFYNIGDYDKALREFKEYLEIYISGAHRNEAYRHIARIYFDQFDYQKSVQAYTAIFEESSNEEEGISAYYKTGICYQKMGNDSKAMEVFENIIRQYPYSSYANLSKIQIDLLNILQK